MFLRKQLAVCLGEPDPGDRSGDKCWSIALSEIKSSGLHTHAHTHALQLVLLKKGMWITCEIESREIKRYSEGFKCYLLSDRKEHGLAREA